MRCRVAERSGCPEAPYDFLLVNQEGLEICLAVREGASNEVMKGKSLRDDTPGGLRNLVHVYTQRTKRVERISFEVRV